MYPFPSINQFRHVVGQVRRKASFIGLDTEGEPQYNAAAVQPTLAFIGTVKLHGTNAAIVFSPEGLSFQSRERVLTHTEDNAGFYNHMLQHGLAIQQLHHAICAAAKLDLSGGHTIAVYGEWCGGNIQKNVAIAGLPKMFVIFAIRINDAWFTDYVEGLRSPEASIYDIQQFAKWFMNIDFNKPEVSQNHLVRLTEAVEASCPVGKVLGQEGIGEGIVWRCIEDPSSDMWFKVKGEKHSASKVKTLASVDVEAVEKVRDFVAMTVTEARLEQGLANLVNEQLKPFDMTSMGDFIRWIHGDVVKEEADTIEANGLDSKKLGVPIALAAKRWYVERLNKETFGEPA
jgi:hypothetical protein